MYKIETHLHTVYASACGHLDARTIVEAYAEAGYSGLVVTDHFNRITFDYLKIDLRAGGDKVGPFLEGYRRVAEEAKKFNLQVYQGAELRFDECDNDYLLYGFREELLESPDEIFAMGIAAFSPIARGQGALLIQAHPYRKSCTPAIARYLDGVEVRNLHPRHESHNAWAASYAQQFGLIGLCGSDCHRAQDMALGGISADRLPKDSMALARLLRSRQFGLLGKDE